MIALGIQKNVIQSSNISNFIERNLSPKWGPTLPVKVSSARFTSVIWFEAAADRPSAAPVPAPVPAPFPPRSFDITKE